MTRDPAAGSGVSAAAAALQERLADRRPSLALTMGSGLGGLAERIQDPLLIPYDVLPGWPRPTVAGHAGTAVSGWLGGVQVLGFGGRVHMYEGHEQERTAFYVRVLARLGVPVLFLSNAAGAINRSFAPGDLMLIADHINLMFRNPLIGPVESGEGRFPDMSDPYDPRLAEQVRLAAMELRIPVQEGVYAAVPGPSYETPAEIRMLDRLGADAVGMSTVPEVIAARASGIRCVAVSCLTNYAAGVSTEPLDHQEVLETGRRVAGDFQRLVTGSVQRIGALLEDAS